MSRRSNLFLLLLLLFLAAPMAAQTATNPCSVPTRVTSADKRSYTTTQKCLVLVDTVRLTKTDTVVKTVTVVRVDTVRVPVVVQPPTTPDTTTPPVVQPPTPSGYTTPNRPSNYTKTVSDLDLGPAMTVPACTGKGNGDERYLAGLSNTWSFFGDCTGGLGSPSRFSFVTVDGRTALRLIFPGTPTTDGTTYGNLGRPLPNVNEVYASYWIKWDAGFEFNPISSKHLRMEKYNGNFLLQASHDNQFLRASDEGIGQPYEPQDGSKPALGFWHQVEVLVKTGNPGTVKVWLDGKLRTSYTNLPVTGPFQTFSIDGHLGGGGTEKTRDSFYWLDRVVVATP